MNENRRPVFTHEARANPIGYNQYKHGGAGKNGPVLPGGKSYAQSIDAAANAKDKAGLVNHKGASMGSLAKTHGFEKNSDTGGFTKTVSYAGKTVTAGVRPGFGTNRGKFHADVPVKRGNTVKTVTSIHRTADQAFKTAVSGLAKITSGPAIKPKPSYTGQD